MDHLAIIELQRWGFQESSSRTLIRAVSTHLHILSRTKSSRTKSPWTKSPRTNSQIYKNSYLIFSIVMLKSKAISNTNTYDYY